MKQEFKQISIAACVVIVWIISVVAQWVQGCIQLTIAESVSG